VDYYRIPITDECAPEEKDFDQIVNTLKELGPTTAVVFNCASFPILFQHSHTKCDGNK
jgi:protein-tyrosine phosphatase